MSIQVRRGANADFDSSKMLPGELAVTTDGSRKAYVAFQAGDVKELVSKEEVQKIVDNFDKNVAQEIEDAKNAVIEEAEKQVQNVINKAYEVLESIPDDYEELAKQSDEAVRTKADAILCTASGKSIVVKDSSNDYVRNLKPYGKTKQRTTTGANKLPYPYTQTTITTNGITYTDNGDGSISIKGTSTGDAYFQLFSNSENPIEGTYFLSGLKSGLGYKLYAYAGGSYEEDNGDGVLLSNGIASINILVAADVTIDTTLYPMLNTGTEDLPWEPYTGGLPSPSMEYQQPLENVGMWGNLCNLPDGVYEYRGITWNCTNGVISVKGTASDYSITSNSSLCYDIAGMVGTFYISGTKNNVMVCIIIDKADGTYLRIQQDKSFTLDGTETRALIYMQVDPNITVDTTIYPMLNYGTTALPYRPYSGQMELESGVYGGNLLPYPYFETTKTENGVTFTDNKDGSILVNGTATGGLNFRLVKSIKIKKGTYTISGTKLLKGMLLRFYDVSGNKILFDVPDKIDSLTIDLDKDYEDVYIYLNQNQTGIQINGIVRPMLNYGTEALPYEPYTRQSHINLLGETGLPGIPLGQTIPDVIKNSPIHMAGVYWDEEDGQYWIGDTVDNESGERTVTNETLIFDGMGDWYSNTSNDNGFVAVLNISKSRIYNTIPMLCSHSVFSNNISVTSPNGSKFGMSKDGGVGAVYFFIPYSMAADVSEWKSVLEEQYANGTPVKVQYILAKPYTEKLTAGEIESYKGLRSNYHVTTVVNDCDCHEEFSYNADTKCYIDSKFAELAEKLLA